MDEKGSKSEIRTFERSSHKDLEEISTKTSSSERAENENHRGDVIFQGFQGDEIKEMTVKEDRKMVGDTIDETDR